MFVRFAAVLVTFCLATTAFAKEHSVSFTKLHARPTASTKIAIAYFTATSTGKDAILAVRSDCCKAVELHRTEKINGVMTMRRIAELSLEKDTPFDLQPSAKGGEHLMLIGLGKPLNEGDSVTVTFTMKKAGEKTVTFPVTGKLPDDDVHELH